MTKSTRVIFSAVASLAIALSGHSAPVFLSEFGSQGSGPGQFEYPWGIAYAPDGTIYVVDNGGNRISYFNPDGIPLGSFGASGTGDGEFNNLYYVAVSPDGTELAVGDYSNDRVQFFTRTGGFLRRFDTPDRANAVLYQDAQTLLVTDYQNDKVDVFSTLGTPGGSFGQGITEPEGIAQSPDGNLAVCGADDDRVYLFDPARNATGSFGGIGTGPGQFETPTGVAWTSGGNLLITDSDNDRVQIFSGTGGFLGEFGGAGSGPGQMSYPTGISILPNGKIYVVDSDNYRVQIFVDPAYAQLPTATKTGKKQIKIKKKRVKLRGTATAGPGTFVDAVTIRGGKRKRILAKGTNSWKAVVPVKTNKKRSILSIQSTDQLGQVSAIQKVRVRQR